MAVFPLFAASISLVCAAVIGRDALARPRPEKVAWTIAFATFAVAAGAEAVAAFGEWTPLLVRLFYLTGAVLVVGYLGLGELYLLAPRRMAAIPVVPGLAILVTAVAATLVWSAPIDEARLAEDGWRAMERGPALVALVAFCSGVGSVVLVGGTLWSAWTFRRLGTQRHRMIGCLLIAVGTVTVAAKGTLARTGLPDDAFGIAMAVGVSLIFAGYLETRRTDGPRSIAASADQAALGIVFTPVPARPASDALGGNGSATGGTGSIEPAIAFIEQRFLPLDDAALAEICRVWSVPRSEADSFSRDEARSVWALRLRLSGTGQARFDALSVGAKRQLAELYHDVLAPARAEVRARETVGSRR